MWVVVMLGFGCGSSAPAQHHPTLHEAKEARRAARQQKLDACKGGDTATCTELSQQCASHHGEEQDSVNATMSDCGDLFEKRVLADAELLALAKQMCDGDAWKCDVLEDEAKHAGDDATAKEAHTKRAEWLCAHPPEPFDDGTPDTEQVAAQAAACAEVGKQPPSQ